MLNTLMLETLCQADGLKENREAPGFARHPRVLPKTRPPVWLMRQAGRYMPSYQKLRKRHTLRDMFCQPELIVQVTLLPVEELKVDAAIIFSDILLILDAMGIDVIYGEEGVRVKTIDRLDDARLFQATEPVMAKFGYLEASLKQLRPALKVPLMGFVAAPFTLACYALDGSKAALASNVRHALWTQPLALEKLQMRLSEYVFALAKLQVDAGAQVLQIFDSHTHVLSQDEYDFCVMPALSCFLKRLEGLGVPLVYFSRMSQLFNESLHRLPPCALGIDWQSDMGFFRKSSPRVLQGNFNPWKLMQPPLRWKSELIESLKADPLFRTICSLGHGVLPQTPWSHVRAFVDTILEFKG